VKIEIAGAQLDQYANTFRIISFDEHGVIYDIRDISGDDRKRALALACRRARGMLRDFRHAQKSVHGHAHVWRVDGEGVTLTNEAPLYTAK
jgi:hypothetical protein